MKRNISTALAMLMLASCSTMSRNGSDSNNNAGNRIERVSRFLTKTVINVTDDMLPFVAATTGEVIDELKSDLPKVTDEVSSQMRHITSVRRSSGPDR
jgi:hypothetical protein